MDERLHSEVSKRKGQSKIEIVDDVLTITVFNEYLNRDYLYVLSKSEINAFEIYKGQIFPQTGLLQAPGQP